MIFWGVAVLVLISLLRLFTWEETLSFSRPINDQKITNFFLILGAVAAAPTLYFLVLQIREQQKIRQAAVFPELYPVNTSFALEYQSFEMGGNEYIQPVPPRNRNPDAKGFCITNIGIGSAKAIKTEWLYDKKSVDHLADGHYSFFDKMGNGDKTFINFLRPGDEARIILPLYYLICCGTALNLKSSSSGSDGKFGYKPPLQLQIEYLDIYNKSFTSKFSVDVTAYSDLVTLNFGPPDKLVKG